MTTPLHRTLVWIHHEKRRVYRCTAGPDLVSPWTVMRFWGSIDTGHGGHRVTVHESEAAMWAEFESVSAVRRQRGYCVASNDR